MLILREENLKEAEILQIKSTKEIKTWITSQKTNKFKVELIPNLGGINLKMVSYYDRVKISGSGLELSDGHKNYFIIAFHVIKKARFIKLIQHDWHYLSIETETCSITIFPN